MLVVVVLFLFVVIVVVDDDEFHQHVKPMHTSSLLLLVHIFHTILSSCIRSFVRGLNLPMYEFRGRRWEVEVDGVVVVCLPVLSCPVSTVG